MSYRPKKRNNQLWEKMLKKIFFRYFLPAIIIFLSSIFIFNADFFTVKDISFVNTKNTDSSFLREISKDAIKGKYIGLYNKNNFFFYPESKMEAEILKAEEKIKSVDISYSGWAGNLEIDVDEKVAAYLYCVGKKEKCYFMEHDGKIFTEFKQNETEILKKDFLIFSQKMEDKKKPTEIWEEKKFKEILDLLEEIKNINIEIKKVEKKDFGEIVFLTKNSSKIVFQLKQDFSKIPETLKKLSIRKDLKISKAKKDFKNKIEYINLSHGENIFYCTAGEECKNNF